MDKFLACYHGTSKESAEKILSTRTYKASGSDEWLGRGVYFFENDPIQAHKFVKAYKKLSDETVQVLFTKICVMENMHMVDLTIDEDRNFLEEYERRIREKITSTLSPNNIYWTHKEGYALDFLFENRPYALVRAAYDIPKRNRTEGFGYAQVHIQVCVKQPSCIMKDTIRCHVVPQRGD